MKHYLLTTSAIFRFLLFSFLLLWSDVGWGQTAECGIYQKLGGIPQGYRGPVITDRFGNQFTLQEVQEGASVECTDSGIFDLHYISNSAGGFSAAEMSTICTVFKQVSDLIAPGNTTASIRINIARFAPGDNDPLAFASGLYTEECGLLNSNILQILQTGVNPLGNGVAAGYIHVRPTPPGSNTWYTTENETDPVGALPSSVGGTQYDLHSVILHEVGHLLGFASRIGESGAPLSGSGYSVWDSYLSANGHPLVLSDTDPEAPCCDAHLFNYSFFPNMPDPLNTGCGNNVKFIHPAVSQSPPVNSTGVNVTTDGEMANKLSHLAADCPGGANFVMHATFNTGEVKRGFTTTEQQILCALGYSGGMSCGSNAGCQPVANDDAALFILSEPGPYVVDVLSNDAPTTGTVALVADCGDLPNLPSGMTVTVTTGGLQVNSPQPGTWTFCYSLTTTCAGITRCDQAVARVVIRQNAVPTTGCAGCNLVCFGDFEDFEPGLAGGGGGFSIVLLLRTVRYSSTAFLPWPDPYSKLTRFSDPTRSKQ